MRVAVGTDQGVMVLKPGDVEGSTWTLVSHGQHNRRIEAICQAPSGDLYVGADFGTVYRTRDGENWQSFVEGLTYTSVHALSLHPDEPNVLYAGTQPAAIFRSTDGGPNWEKLASFHSVPSATKWSYPVPPYRAMVTCLLQHPQHPKAIMAGIAMGGLIASLDGGVTWAERHQGLGKEMHALVMHPARPARLFAATGGGLFRSEDLGASWTQMTAGLPYSFARSIAVDPDNPDRLMAGLNQQRDGGTAVIARSADGGNTWQVVAHGLPSLAGQSITAVAAGPGHFLMGTDAGLLFATANFGDFWQRIRNTCPPVRRLVNLNYPMG